MQNKPNFRKAGMNANFCFTKDYENDPASGVRQNKPNFKTPPAPIVLGTYALTG
jgi:hypothetical protein